jgi:hypothetical protein
MLLQLEASLITIGKTRRKIKLLIPRKSKAATPFPISKLRRLAVQQQQQQQQKLKQKLKLKQRQRQRQKQKQK